MKRAKVMKRLAVVSGLAVSLTLFVKRLRGKVDAELLHKPVG